MNQQNNNSQIPNRVLLQQSTNVPYGYGVQQNPPVPTSIVVPHTYEPRYQQPMMADVQMVHQPPQQEYNPPPPHISNSFYVDDPVVSPRDQVQRTLIDQNKASSKEKLVNWCTYLCPLLFLLLATFLTAQIIYAHQHNLAKPDETQGIISNLILNLDRPLIADVQPLAYPAPQPPTTHTHLFKHMKKHLDTPTCPNGFEMANLGQWKGVNAGCLCDDGTIHNRIYCTFKRGSSCQYVHDQDPQKLQQWKDQRLCIKTVSDWKWVGSKPCPSNYKLCQGGVCVKTADSCPLSGLVTPPIPAQASTNPPITIGSTLYSRSFAATTQPWVGFSITPGANTNAPCYNLNVAPTFQSTKYFPLAVQPESGCTQQTTAYTQQLDSQVVPNVYQQNSLTDQLKNIPFYNSYIVATDTYDLQGVQRVKIGGDPACDDLSASNLNIVLTRSNQLYSLCRWVSITVLTIACVGLVITIILFILRGRSMDACNMNTFEQTKIIYIFALLAAFFLLFLGAVYLHHVDASGGLKDLHEKFKGYISKQCFAADPPIQDALTKVDTFSFSTYSQTESWVKTAFAFSIVFLVLSAIFVTAQHFAYREPWCHDPWKVI